MYRASFFIAYTLSAFNVVGTDNSYVKDTGYTNILPLVSYYA